MIDNAYYLLKPLIPWRWRLAVRRWRANARRTAFADVWPIDEKAGMTPPGWPGWPDGKRFALVLTHDVEGSKGLQRVEQLMKLELKHGFRSSFNFVAEGEYRVPDALRRTLNEAGFEVGLHGLEHDGKLYNSKVEFGAKAARIRQYLQQWGASGFRSPLMQHKLAWLHALGVEYDASTFDTDPFEPQPDGVGTVFPFWVPGSTGTGYVELPYTLPQDFTLFVVLREKNIDIWKRKLDWIAARGGMALLDTHPDYMCFGRSEQSRDEYPLSYYEEFLCYAREKYEGVSWPALPRDVVRFYCAKVPPSSRNSRKKICMLTHSHYESDNRVRRYAETLAKRGDQVDVIALSGGRVQLGTEEINGVTAYRIQRREHNERRKWTYAWRLMRFFLSSLVFLTHRHNRTRYDVIHVHNMPDFLVFAAWYPKLTGTKVILDIHDLVPELFADKFKTHMGGLYVRLLEMIERASVAFADHVIISNHLWYDKLIARTAPVEKCSVFLNHVDPGVFYRRDRTRNDTKVVIVFPGTFQRHQGLDIAIEAFDRVKDRVPNAEFHLYGQGSETAELMSLTERLGLTGRIKFFESVTLDRVPEVIANADLGVVPKRADSFGDEAYSTKIMEFMSQGVPVVVSRTRIDSYYFDDAVVRFFTSGDSRAMAEAMLDVIENKELRDGLVSRGFAYAERNSWDGVKNEYLALVDSLSREPNSVILPPPSLLAPGQIGARGRHPGLDTR